MTKRELLENYLSIVRRIKILNMQSDFLNNYIGGPRPVHAAQLTGMPRGTNEPEAAIMQRADYDDAIYELEQKEEELRGYLHDFNRILDSIENQDDADILRYYYGLGWTDKKIAEEMNYDKSTIWKRRTKTISALD